MVECTLVMIVLSFFQNMSHEPDCRMFVLILSAWLPFAAILFSCVVSSARIYGLSSPETSAAPRENVGERGTKIKARNCAHYEEPVLGCFRRDSQILTNESQVFGF